MQPRQFVSTIAVSALAGLGHANADVHSELQTSPPKATAPSEFSVRTELTEPIVDGRDAQELWVRTRDMRARFAEDGATFYPAFGRASMQEWPVHVDVAQATIGGASIDVTASGRPSIEGMSVTQRRAGFDEVHHLSLGGVEQTFVFDSVPAEGDLVVRLDVETELTPTTNGDQLRFHARGLGYVELSGAVVLDSGGNQLPISREWSDSGVELRVPSEFLESAVWPVTIDPLWSTFVNSFGTADDAHPDIAFSSVTQEYLVVWEDFTSNSNSDVYLSAFSSDFSTLNSTTAIDIGNDSWVDPAIGYASATDEALIAASVGLDGNTARIESVRLDVSTLTVGAKTVSSTIGGTNKVGADVGGSNYQTNLTRFAIAWTRTVGQNDHDVQYTVLGNGASVIQNVTTIDFSNENDIQATISSGLGDVVKFGDNWHIAWIRENNGDGAGRVMAQRIHFTGNPANHSAIFPVSSFVDASNPSVSSLMDDTLSSTGQRAAIVAYERRVADISRPSGYQTDVRVAVISDAQVESTYTVSSMEDYDVGLLQSRPQVATDGKAFYVTYLEEDAAAVGQGILNVFMASGEVDVNDPFTGVALAESHVELSSQPVFDQAPTVAMRWDSDPGANSTRGGAVWSVDLLNNSPNFGRIEGAGFEYILPHGSVLSPVGTQFGEANSNSLGGLESGWIRVLGDASVASPHLVQAVNLPQNSFGYLLTSSNFGDTNMPGGSHGRLLLGGNIGRYLDQVQSSGQAGRISVVVDPQNLAQPNGSVAAVIGQRWYFQVWHRDSVNGQLTSNFTNAAQVRFVN